MRKTARVSFIVEYDADDYPEIARLGADLNLPDSLKLKNDSVFITKHNHPWRALRHAELTGALLGIEDRGGSFMKALGGALLRADSNHIGRLTDEFWNEISNYLPEGIK